jgi:hypothetical protein
MTRTRRSHAGVLAITATVAAGWLIAACSAGSGGSHASPPTSPPGPTASPARPGNAPAWLLTRAALSQLVADQQARDRLLAARVFEILRPGQRPLPGVAADAVVTFASAAALEQAVTGGQIPSGTYGVLYDPEAWSFTPPDEQRDPVRAATGAAAVAHAHGLRFFVSPALNLSTVLAPGSRLPRWQSFLGLGLLGPLADVADVVELQAQSLERDTGSYAAFVRAAARQATEANPRITVLAGLSTNPPGAPVDSAHLISAIRATRSMVSGYWLNIPGQGPRCPTCGAARPDIAIRALRQLG